MMRRDRMREDLRVCRAAWLIGVSVREYGEIEAGDRTPSGYVPPDLRAVREAAVLIAGEHDRKGSSSVWIAREADHAVSLRS
jgi:hypothetical protein